MDHILFNSLALFFPGFPQLDRPKGQDILFCKSPCDELPGNMQLILEIVSRGRGKAIVIPDLATYEKAKSLAAADQQQVPCWAIIMIQAGQLLRKMP